MRFHLWACKGLFAAVLLSGFAASAAPSGSDIPESKTGIRYALSQPTGLGALPPRHRWSRAEKLAKLISQGAAPSGRTSVLAWAPPTSSSTEIIQPWYQLREWNSLASGEVCGTDSFQQAMQRLAAEAKSATDAMPQGRKAILVFWELTPHWDDPRDFVRNKAGVVQGWRDEAGGFHPYLSPWWGAGALESRCRIESFFETFHKLGGALDYVVLDTEHVMSNWQLDNFARERYGATSQRVSADEAENRRVAYYAAIEADPRMDQLDPDGLGIAAKRTLRQDLSQGSLAQHVAKWWYPEVKNGPNRYAYLQWNQLMKDRAARYLNFAVTEPIKTQFPRVKISDYDFQYTTPAHNLPDMFGHRVSMFAPEVIAGNVQSRAMYGVLRDLSYFYVQSPFLAYQGTPFNALRFNLNALRSGVLSRPDVPFQAWIAPKSFGPAQGCSECRFYQSPMYEEMLFHTLLSTTEPLLFWNPLGVSSAGDEAAIVAALSEYDKVTGPVTRRNPKVAGLIDWNADYILSSQESERATVYRYTPHLEGGRKVGEVVKSYSPARLVTPSGKQLSFDGGLVVSSALGSAGVWIVVPKKAALNPKAAPRHSRGAGR